MTLELSESLINIQQVFVSFERLEKSDVKYCFVIEISS